MDSSRPQGLLFVATGDKYIAEAVTAAESYAVQMPDVPRAMATRGEFSHGLFEQVIQLPDGVDCYGDKIDALAASPYEKTIFVDTDTICLEPIDDLFDGLNHWDLLAAHAPVREFLYSPPEVPAYFPECNTGVLGVKHSPASKNFLKVWSDCHQEICEKLGRRSTDQPAFRRALWATKLPFLVLTPEYNLRTCMNYFIGGNSAVRIVHDRTGRAKETLAILKGKRVSPYPRVR